MFLNLIRQLAYKGICGEITSVSKSDVSALSAEDLSVLHSVMIGPHVSLALAMLQRIGFFEELIPEIQEGLNLSLEKNSNGQFKDIWPHTIRVVGQAPPQLNIRWAALFHDLGKAKAYSIKNNKVTFHHHEYISARIFDQFAERTGIFSGGQRRNIRFLVAHLGYVENYDNTWSDSAVRRFDKEMGIYLEDLLTLSEADITTSRPANRNLILNRIRELRDRIADIREKDAKQCPLPKGLGTAIADTLGIPLGPRIGELRKELEVKIQQGELSANEDISYYIEHLKKTQVESPTNSPGY
jgi:poly(A) polymerase